MNGYRTASAAKANKDTDLQILIDEFVSQGLRKAHTMRLADVVTFARRHGKRRRVDRVVTAMRVRGDLVVTADGLVVGRCGGPVNTFDELALFDWVYTADDKHRRLHAAVGLHTYFDDDDTSGFASTLCGRSSWLEIPGVFSRMGTKRCKKCCRAAKIPTGVGSPKNDARVRHMFGLPTGGY